MLNPCPSPKAVAAAVAALLSKPLCARRIPVAASVAVPVPPDPIRRWLWWYTLALWLSCWKGAKGIAGQSRSEQELLLQQLPLQTGKLAILLHCYSYCYSSAGGEGGWKDIGASSTTAAAAASASMLLTYFQPIKRQWSEGDGGVRGKGMAGQRHRHRKSVPTVITFHRLWGS